MPRNKPSTYIQRIRVEAALTAYETAHDWFQRLPALEVEERFALVRKQKRAQLEALALQGEVHPNAQ